MASADSELMTMLTKIANGLDDLKTDVAGLNRRVDKLDGRVDKMSRDIQGKIGHVFEMSARSPRARARTAPWPTR